MAYFKIVGVDTLIDLLTENIDGFGDFWSGLDEENKEKFSKVALSVLEDFDYLVSIYEEQGNLDDYVLKNKARWMPSEKDILIALISESVEMLNHTDFKWWSNKSSLNREELFKEGIDLVHFLLSFFRKLKYLPEDIFDAYMKKNKINHERAQGDY